MPWQVPSPVVLATSPPGAQRGNLKDALMRAMEVTAVRMAPRQTNEFLAMAQPAVLAALTEGPAGAGEAFAALLAGPVPLGRRRGDGAASAARRLGRLRSLLVALDPSIAHSASAAPWRRGGAAVFRSRASVRRTRGNAGPCCRVTSSVEARAAVATRDPSLGPAC